MTSERAFQVLVQAGVVVILARHLGPGGLGVVATVAALTTLLTSIQNAGLDTWLADEAVRSESSSVASNALTIRVALGALITIGLLAAAALSEGIMRAAYLMVILAIMAQPLDTGRPFLEVTHRASSFVSRRVVVVLAAGLIQVVLVLAGAPLAYFVLVTVLIPTFRFLAVGRLPAGTHIVLPARDSFARAVPLLLTSLAVGIYLQIDILMLNTIAGTTEAGIYAAAARVSEAPIIVLASLAVSLQTMQKAENPISLEEIFQVVTAAALPSALFLFAIGPSLIDFAFGPRFHAAGGVLRIHVVSLVFVGWGTVRSYWIIRNKLESWGAVAALTGAGSNVGLNLVLIERLGATGAAIATVVSYAVAVCVMTIALPALRPAAVPMLVSLRPRLATLRRYITQ